MTVLDAVLPEEMRFTASCPVCEADRDPCPGDHVCYSDEYCSTDRCSMDDPCPRDHVCDDD